ncbi:hypothetical protein DPSP01_011656 [Paraphaeosphaeria sporulosa]|uniref:Sensor histidine kinase-like protein/response regulator n=1 Tax=Paraphaeosphaeria sporulosa TaxID=1460663 RepID=A0A177CZ66_9PLEO|nr:uncharacterized protein CC84DRAFT_1108202 [Paraphaeosphaeria sporulosa]OAG12130.1 hypothetical protein CC84DRAFT_1108202 [Paraphaeosphaeria sporulosa]
MVDRGPASARSQNPRDPMDEADRTKEREFYRYYHVQRPQEHGRPNGTPVLAPLQTQSLPEPVPDQLIPSDDTALAAFAQLGALRLNCRRCLISFFDRRNCFILAEATRTACLVTGRAEVPEDDLAFGTSIFPKDKSICYYTVKLPWGHPPPFDEYAHHPSLVVNDLTRDERFKNYPFVEGAPHSRFYAGVPIRSPNGHNIGTYCVLDDKPRNGLSQSEMRFLKDMAGTVMRHLETSRAAEDHKRGGVMVKSLGSFADGKSSIDDWWEETEATASPSETTPMQRQRRPTVNAMSPTATTAQPGMLARNHSAESSVPSVNSPGQTSMSSIAPSSTVGTPASEILDPVKPEVLSKMASATGNGKPDAVASDTKAIFERAARMIAEAVEAEGAVFFDAKVSTFGGLVDDDFTSEQPPEPDKPCVVLGAARFKSSQNSSSPSSQIFMTESVLKHLLRNYTHGQIFNFDDDYSPTAQADAVVGDDVDLMISRKSDSVRSADDEQALREVFPRARSLIIYPLWDAHRDRWFSSLIIWSSDPMRVFTNEQELSYLSAFSNSVMAEVARLDTRLADSAKADFISSISHELRSPLHGILGMTDLLKDTSIDTQQQSHIQTIENCGKTLLETINHVLDYAKINNLTRGASKRRPKRRTKSAKHVITPSQGHTNDIMTIISDFDLSILIEEVLETVFAGFNFSKNNFESLDQGPRKYEPPPVSVIVDVNKWDSYVFRTQPGAWRRIVMNLFGNALKYTPAGFIKVKLQVVPNSDRSDENMELKLTVTDSGIGMSEDYINNRLFHSFAQENPLSQGTGLGLSIVKQLVEILGGDVEVRSEKDRGTKFIVSCPLKPSSLSPTVSALNPAQEIPNVFKRTTGKVVQFMGFDDGDEVEVTSLKNKNASAIGEKALKEMCKDWFGLDVWDPVATNAPAPNLIMATEAGARRLRAQFSKTPNAVPLAPVIVLCRAAALAQSTTAITVPGLIFECIAQPCGPHKLAKAIVSCLDRQANRLVVESTETDNTSLSGISQLLLKENAAARSSTKPISSSLSLPRPHVKSAISAPEIRSVNQSPASPIHVPSNALNCLAVDDNPINLRLLRSFVEKLGHRHVLAKNGLEALVSYKASTLETAVLKLSRVDVILMDINMPEMDGLEATRQIRAYERDNSLPPVTIIALTGLASSEAQQEAHASGVNLFLIKPVRLADLEVVLKGVVTSEEGAKVDDIGRGEKSEDSAEGLGPEVEVREEGSGHLSVGKPGGDVHERSKSSV